MSEKDRDLIKRIAESEYKSEDIINVNFDIRYVVENIRFARNNLIKFYGGGYSVEYVNSLTLKEFIAENKIAQEIVNNVNRS